MVILDQFDNIELELLPALRDTLAVSDRADFCVGYFNLRGWKSIDGLIEKWAGGTGQQCRLFVGMQRLPQEELREAYSLLPNEEQMSQQAVIRLKRRLAEEFRSQLTIGAPTDADEAGLRRLSAQLKAGQVVVGVSPASSKPSGQNARAPFDEIATVLCVVVKYSDNDAFVVTASSQNASLRFPAKKNPNAFWK
ncbi:MAG: hypothetical protein WCJ35_19830 [Planctomycetota bacterium]